MLLFQAYISDSRINILNRNEKNVIRRIYSLRHSWWNNDFTSIAVTFSQKSPYARSGRESQDSWRSSGSERVFSKVTHIEQLND